MDKTAMLDRTSMDLGMSAAEAAQYRVGRAIMAALAPQKEKGSFEYDVSVTLSEKMGRPGRGANSIFVPFALRPQMSGLDTKLNTSGGYLVGTEIPELIDALRTQTRCIQLGATFISGLSSNLAWAVETATTAATFVSENPGTDVADTDMSFGTKTMTPHELQSTTSLSRQVLAQNSVDLERRIRVDLIRSHAIAFDGAAIAGTGTSNQPVGLLQTANLPTVAIGTNGGAASYAHLCGLEETISDANADSQALAFLTTPAQRSKLRQVFKNGTGSEEVWDSDDAAGGPLGYRGAVSKAVPATLTKGTTVGSCHAIIGGNFSEMLLGQFGVIEIIADPYLLKRQGMVQVTSFSMVDVLIHQVNAFAVIVDAV